MYMDGIKLFVENEKEQETLIQTIRKKQPGLRN